MVATQNEDTNTLRPKGAYLIDLMKKLERAKGFEPSTPTLARLCSTPELRPLWRPEDVSLSAGEAGN